MLLFLPFPHSLDELLPADLEPVYTFFSHQLPIHDGVGGYTRMVCARHPQGVIPLHPLPPDQDVLESHWHGVSLVQNAGDIRGRNDYGIGRPVGGVLRMKIAFLHPE